MSKWLILIKSLLHFYAHYNQITLFRIHHDFKLKKFCICKHRYRETYKHTEIHTDGQPEIFLL